MSNKTQSIKYFLYARKSSEAEDRQVASIDAQEKELTKLARTEKLELIDILSEAQSAKAPGRPLFNNMIQRIDKGEARGVICWKLDRLTRNPVDSGTISWMLQKGAIQHIKTFERSYYPADNVLMMSVEFGMANQFLRDLSVNVKRGLRNKVAMGWFPGVAPAGYLNTPEREKGFKKVVIDPIRFPLIRKMWDLMLTGNYNPTHILDIANKEWGYTTSKHKHIGGNPMSRSAVYKLFANPFYYGWFQYPDEKGDWYQGKHKPMITKAEFERVQYLLGKRGRPQPQKHRFAFTGTMKCGNCGASITAENKAKHQKNGNIHRYVYYHCTKRIDKACQNKCLEEKELCNQIDTILSQISISDKFLHWAIKYLHEVRTSQAQAQEASLEIKQVEYREVIKQLDALLLKFSRPENEDGQFISNEEYQTVKSRLLARKSSLEAELKFHGEEVEKWVELSEKTFNFARYARFHFENGDIDTKRAVLASLGSNLELNNKKISISLHPMFKTIADYLPQAERELVAVRTSNEVGNKKKNETFGPEFPTVLRR